MSMLKKAAGVLCALTVVVSAAAQQLATSPSKEGPSPKTANYKGYAAPRIAGGQPDLQGVWNNANITPLERPADLANKAFFASAEEAQAWASRALYNVNSERRDGGAQADVSRSYNEFWRDRPSKLLPNLRTSLIVDPADGRIPLTPEARSRIEARVRETRLHPADGPESLGLWERCITRGGAPMLPGPYNNDFQIVQTPAYVVLYQEMIHEARVVPLDGRPHPPAGVRLWLGDSRGHWEGETLVVDTTNFSEKTNFRGAGPNLHLIERFQRTGPDSMLYQFTAEDPTTFARPWSAELQLGKIDSPIFEYACQEGNYAMSGILGGARALEKAAPTGTGSR